MTNSKSIVQTKGASRNKRLANSLIEGSFLVVASLSMISVIFIVLYIAKDALPFFEIRGIKEFFTSTRWYPADEPAEFGVLSIIYGSFMVTALSTLFAVPIAIFSSVCLSDILPFSIRQVVKPIVEIIAAVPSVAYGFFAIVIFAPLLQDQGGHLLGVAVWLIAFPISCIAAVVLGELITDKLLRTESTAVKGAFVIGIEIGFLLLIHTAASALWGVTMKSGTNTLNVSVILAIMSLPTIVSVSEDSLQAVGRELREGSYALGATRAETLWKVVIPTAKSGIIAAIILGVMRAIGETMVVWMASGNSAHLPEPLFNIFEPIRTLTATIAGDMGEADHVTGSARYHVLFAMALFLLLVSLASNFISEWFVEKSRKKWRV